jgi:hypothetical protein
LNPVTSAREISKTGIAPLNISLQYERWRKLRQLQCENKRSLRDYCNVTATTAAPAR